MKMNLTEEKKKFYQETFDTIYDKLVKQGVRSMAPDYWLAEGKFGCAYRGDNGNKCAIGHIIPDELYDPLIETKAVFSFSLMERNLETKRLKDILEKIGFGEEDADFLVDLQDAHDNYLIDDVNTFKCRMNEIAIMYGLKGREL